VTAVADGSVAAIEVERLTKEYGGRAVVSDLSFRVGRGETFALLGPNGAGKTTTVEIIEGYRRPDGGSVRVLGVDPARAGRDHRARVGLMLQGGGGVDPRMTAREVLRLHGRFHASPRDADELLELVGLVGTAARTRFRRLSGGERQRLGLALALVGRPVLVALDEPTAGMDVEARAATRGLIGRLRDEGVTILLTSHDLGDVEKVADRIAIIDRGRLVGLGTPSDLAGSSTSIRFRLDTALTPSDLADLSARVSPVVAEDGSHYRFDGGPATPAMLASLAGWCEARGMLIVELRVGESLEERYLELTGGASEPATVSGSESDA
jgi:ABC-2 type transport system ATP-binding protein